jgi:hypothetical protein
MKKAQQFSETLRLKPQNNSYNNINLLAPEFDIKILAHPVCKMCLTQEPKNLTLQNTQHFEEKRRRHCNVFKKN